MSGKFSICALFYGDSLFNAQRCLASLKSALANPDEAACVQDIRLALHIPSEEVSLCAIEAARYFSKELKIKTIIYRPYGNVFKYPTMRKMFRDEENPLADYVMWFDDDSYVTGSNPDFFRKAKEEVGVYPLIGQLWFLGVQGNQWEWFGTQPWFNKNLSKPRQMRFMQGAWWCMQRKVWEEYNWPWPELQHNGGDSTLGEMCRHRNIGLGIWHDGVKINADENGVESSSKRRGISQKEIGFSFNGEPLPVFHQYFEVSKEVYE